MEEQGNGQILNIIFTGLTKCRLATISRPWSLPLTTIPLTPSVYKEYCEEQICRAYNAVQEGASVRYAAEQYGISRSTLSDRITGKVKFGAHSGPECYLWSEDEKELISFIYNQQEWDMLKLGQKLV